MRRPIVLILSGVFVIGPLLFAGWTWLALTYVYSTGERAGYVQKLSKKGWLCKTWEGELAMVNLPGAMPEIFKFTVRDEGVARQLTGSMGQRVAITYEYHPGVPTTCFGDTQYYITKVHNVQEAPVPRINPTPAPAPSTPAT